MAPVAGDNRAPTWRFSAALGKTAVILLLVLSVTALYWRTMSYGYVNYDDVISNVVNAWVKDGLTRENTMRAFTAAGFTHWQPMTWLSYMAGYEFFGASAGGQHVINFALHAAGAALLFLALEGATGRLFASAFTAALFALHPLNVESVAWVSERRGALSGFFWMLTLWTYVRYVRRPDIVTYLMVFLSMALGLMSKQMLLTMPFILLLLDYWPLARGVRPPASMGVRPPASIGVRPPASMGVRPSASMGVRPRVSAVSARSAKSLLIEKIPLMLLSLAFIPVAFYAQAHSGAIIDMDAVPLKLRIYNAFVSYSIYVRKIILPYGLSVFYPYYQITVWRAAAAFLVFITASAVAFNSLSRRPYVFVGWAWFVGALVPVIQLVQLGSGSMADRYTYIPAVGLFTAFAWGLDDYAGKYKNRAAFLASVSIVILSLLAFVSWRQVSYWKNTTALFTHAASVTDNNYLAHSELAVELLTEDRPQEALQHLDRAYRASPRDFKINLNIARALEKLGNPSDAEAFYRRAIAIKPGDAAVIAALAVVVSSRGKPDEALKLLSRATELEPSYAEAYYEAGRILYAQGKFREAAKQFAAALYLKPSLRGAADGFSNALRAQLKGGGNN